MSESYFATKKKLAKKVIEPLYLLYGTETFLIEELLHMLIENTLTVDEYDFHLSTYDMKETAVDIAVEDAQTLPFLGGRRVVILKDAYFLTAQKDEWKVEHSLSLLERYIEDPIQETAFVIICPYEKLDERKKLTKLLKKEAVVVEAKTFNDELMKQWLEERANEHEVSFTNEAVERLLERVGKNLLLLASEVEKLTLFVGKHQTITEDVVEQLVAKTIEQDIYMLINAIVARRMDEALQLFFELVKYKNEEPIAVVALLARQIRIQYQVKELMQQGYSQKQIASQLKLHPYVVKLAATYAKQASSEQLHQLLSRLADLDFNMKTGRTDKQLAVELFLLSLKNE